MIFKDRADAGRRLAQLLHEKRFVRAPQDTLFLSLLRGGAVVGGVVADKFHSPHLPLPVVKINHPYQKELAIGALCFDEFFLDEEIVSYFALDMDTVEHQTIIARAKLERYMGVLHLDTHIYKALRGRAVVIVDDGIATGATVKAAIQYIRTRKPSRIVVAAPVAPSDFSAGEAVETAIFHTEDSLLSISRHYETFPQVEDDEVERIFKNSYPIK